MILLWGPGTDPPLIAVGEALRRSNITVVHLEQRAVLSTSLELDIGSTMTARVRSGGQWIDLAAIRACYLRPDNSCLLSEVAAEGEGSAAWLHASGVDDALLSWADMTPARVINRPSAMASNSSKPYQLGLIRAHGFRVPETIITTDPAAVLRFHEEHGDIIYKSLSSVRSIVSKFRLEHLQRLADVSSCPTQFQQFVPGTDYRVHVVGDQVFSSRIVAAADDYRYDTGGPVEITECEIPAILAERCREIAIGLGLPLAGIDLRKTPDEQWYCFEVNPSPGFTFYDRVPGQPIARAVAQLLAQ